MFGKLPIEGHISKTNSKWYTPRFTACGDLLIAIHELISKSHVAKLQTSLQMSTFSESWVPRTKSRNLGAIVELLYDWPLDELIKLLC